MYIGTVYANHPIQVASFKKPTNTTTPTKGVYELKEQYYSEYDVFFYHYSRLVMWWQDFLTFLKQCFREDQSKSEEAQEKRLKALGKPAVCPPPKLPGLTKTYSRLAQVLKVNLNKNAEWEVINLFDIVRFVPSLDETDPRPSWWPKV